MIFRHLTLSCSHWWAFFTVPCTHRSSSFLTMPDSYLPCPLKPFLVLTDVHSSFNSLLSPFFLVHGIPGTHYTLLSCLHSPALFICLFISSVSYVILKSIPVFVEKTQLSEDCTETFHWLPKEESRISCTVTALVSNPLISALCWWTNQPSQGQPLPYP